MFWYVGAVVLCCDGGRRAEEEAAHCAAFMAALRWLLRLPLRDVCVLCEVPVHERVILAVLAAYTAYGGA